MPNHQPNPECKRLLADLTDLAQQSGQDAIWLADGSLCIGLPPQPGDLYSTSYLFHPGAEEVRCDKVLIPLSMENREAISPISEATTTYDLPLTTEGLRRAWAIVQRRLKRMSACAT